jgi:hypothetical protein
MFSVSGVLATIFAVVKTFGANPDANECATANMAVNEGHAPASTQMRMRDALSANGHSSAL